MTFYVFFLLSVRAPQPPPSFLVAEASLQRRVLTYYRTFKADVTYNGRHEWLIKKGTQCMLFSAQ